MRCYNCGDTLRKKTGALQIPSDILNNYMVENVTYFSCPSCKEIILTNEAWEKADDVERQLINKFISNMPIKEFVGASKAALILGKSRQAIHKHRRIRRGFVYSIAHEGKIFYHLKSLELFKESGDGRFELARRTPTKETKYVVVESPILLGKSHSTEQAQSETFGKWTKTPNLVTGKNYAYGN